MVFGIHEFLAILRLFGEVDQNEADLVEPAQAAIGDIPARSRRQRPVGRLEATLRIFQRPVDL